MVAYTPPSLDHTCGLHLYVIVVVTSLGLNNPPFYPLKFELLEYVIR